MQSIRQNIFHVFAMMLVAACAPNDKPAADSATAVAVATTESPSQEKERLRACALVTEAEMSAILGSAVVAEANDRSSGRTECIYKPAQGVSPYVEFSVDWGGGEAAMTAMGMMGQAEPGIASPYAGIGDQAAAVGPTLMIRTGEDLVSLVFSGTADTPKKAKRIFDTAKARM